MKVFRDILDFALQNFLPSVGFYASFRFFGARFAVAFAIVIAATQVVYLKAKKMILPPIFIIATLFIVGFGAVSLLTENPLFYRYEGPAECYMLGLVFLVSLATQKPILNWIIDALPERARPNLTHVSRAYFQKWTAIWGIQFLVKGTIYLILADRVDLGSLALWKGLIGWTLGISLVVTELRQRRRLPKHA